MTEDLDNSKRSIWDKISFMELFIVSFLIFTITMVGIIEVRKTSAAGIHNKVEEHFSGQDLSVRTVEKSPVAGIYVVTTDNGLLYVTEDVDYAITRNHIVRFVGEGVVETLKRNPRLVDLVPAEPAEHVTSQPVQDD